MLEVSSSILVGDCLAVLPTLPASSVDAVVSDPPYGLSFMGKAWDHGVPGVPFWTETLRVMKPGSYLVAFGGTRTYHRLTCAIEDAGFEIQDCLSWLYGSGFPKHRSKLKPAWEPIILARRPTKGATLLNIDACRIGTERVASSGAISDRWRNAEGRADRQAAKPSTSTGRWPANVVLDEDAAEALDAQSGTLTSNSGTPFRRADVGYHGGCSPVNAAGYYGDAGGASRFFYTAKAARSEREAGLRSLPLQTPKSLQGGGEHANDPVSQRFTKTARNSHPTVKPLDLMQWLCRLVTPPGGVVLDPFCGSGTTGCAALSEGMSFIGIERDPEYAEIARQRIAHWGAQIAMPLIGGVA
jgi:site-specific DNA-methyltransferase (adenine-specific)